MRIYGNARGNHGQLSIVQEVLNAKQKPEEAPRKEEVLEQKSEAPCKEIDQVAFWLYLRVLLCFLLAQSTQIFASFILSLLFETGLPPNQGIQGKLGNFIFINEKSGGKIFWKIRENQGSFRVIIVSF